MAKINFGGVVEEVVTREEFPLDKAREVLKDETVAIIGYGVQGPGQALNLRDNGINVIIGQRKDSKTWDKAIADGWVPGVTLFEIEEAAEKGTIIQYLLSDAGQIALWPTIKKYLTPGRTRAIALGIGVGSGYLFETDFRKEVYSDLTGERGTLMGAIAGIFEAQYNTLRRNGHSPSEAFNETVEELTQSLMPLVAENGMDWMYANCSTTAQRGALDWKGRFRDATQPVFDELYESVASGKEAERTIKLNSQPDYRVKLEAELKTLHDSEIWQAGQAVRSLRPENQPEK